MNGDWQFFLYIAGPSPRSAAALTNLRRVCEAHLCGHYDITVIDLVENPERANIDQIVALPTVVRHSPLPVRKVVGDLSNMEALLKGLGLPLPQ